MMKCKNCSEPIGEQVSVCPFCKTAITEEERKEAILENERLHEEAIFKSMEEYSHRLRNEIMVTIAIVAFAIIGMLFIAILSLDVLWNVLLFLGIIAIYLLCVVKLRIGLCPYCESLLGRGWFLRTHCSRCGGRLK